MLLFAPILGLIIGSFLNMLIFRLPRKIPLVKQARSFCPHCRARLQARELIPVISFIRLKGRCAHCRQPISWQYPLVELAAAFLFAAVWYLHQPAAGFESAALVVRDWFFVSILLVVFVIDLRHMLILNKVVLPLLPIVFLINWWLGGRWDWQYGCWLIMAGGLGFSFYALQYYLSRGRWVGGGDMKFGALLGVMLGVQGLAAALFIAYILGAVIALVLIILKLKTMASQLPMGAFLAPAALAVLLGGLDRI